MTENIISMIRSVAAMSVISMLLEYLTPSGSFQSSIRIVIGLVFLTVVSRPIIQMLGSIT